MPVLTDQVTIPTNETGTWGFYLSGTNGPRISFGRHLRHMGDSGRRSIVQAQGKDHAWKDQQ